VRRQAVACVWGPSRTRAIGIALLFGLIACAAAHAPGGSSSAANEPDAAQASSGAGSASPALTPAGASGAANAGSEQTAPVVSTDAETLAACGQNSELTQAVAGAACDQRAALACDATTNGVSHPQAIIANLLRECALTLIENAVAVVFEQGCATRLAVRHSQVVGTEPEAIACLARRLNAQRLECIAGAPVVCVQYEESTIAAQ